MQELSDRSHKFLELFVRLSVQNGLKTAAACKKFGISRSIYYDILSGRREVSPKMEARLLEVARRPEYLREEVINSLLPSEMSELSEIEPGEAASILRESNEMFTKRVDGLETSARYFFEDAAEVFKLAKDLPESARSKSAEVVIVKGMAKSLLALQPWIEQGLLHLIRDNRVLRRIAKVKVDAKK